jgi:hypothetical protein
MLHEMMTAKSSNGEATVLVKLLISLQIQMLMTDANPNPKAISQNFTMTSTKRCC